MPLPVIQLINYVISALTLLILIDVVLSYLVAYGRGPSRYHPAVVLLRRIVNPILEPFRRLLPPSRTGGWDFSPMLVMILLSLVRNMLMRML